MKSIALLIIAAANSQGVPPGLLSAVCYVESHHTTKAIHLNDGNSSSFGLCQVKLSTAQQMGYKGSAASLWNDPKINAGYAAKYLKHQLNRYKGDFICTVAAYNAGRCKRDNNGVIRNSQYVKTVFKAWAEGR